jgi:hypothetical protein
VDDANDVEQRGGADEENSLPIRVSPEVFVVLEREQKCRLDGMNITTKSGDSTPERR